MYTMCTAIGSLFVLLSAPGSDFFNYVPAKPTYPVPVVVVLRLFHCLARCTTTIPNSNTTHLVLTSAESHPFVIHSNPLVAVVALLSRSGVQLQHYTYMIILEYKYSHEEHGLLRSVQCLCGSVSCSTNLRQHDDDVVATKDTLW